MKGFDVQGIELEVPREKAHAFICDPHQLPRWASAFASARDGRAVLRTPNGEVEVGLRVEASAAHGTVDWHMSFPDGSIAAAFSRVVALPGARCVYSFVLTPPPVPLERLEGALEAQARTLREELLRLKRLVEAGG